MITTACLQRLCSQARDSKSENEGKGPHRLRSVTSDPSKLHTTMFPQHTEATRRMTSCHAGSFQGWFET